MLYQSLDVETSIIPHELLKLFVYHQNDILEDDCNLINIFTVCELPEEYTITNKILNTKKTAKTFNETLFFYIDNSDFTETEVYKKAFIDKRLFSKIRSNTNYHPSFWTVTLLALALELSTSEYEDLLNSASYSLPQNSYINITLKYCFDNKIYDINYVDSLIYTISNKLVKNL